MSKKTEEKKGAKPPNSKDPLEGMRSARFSKNEYKPPTGSPLATRQKLPSGVPSVEAYYSGLPTRGLPPGSKKPSVKGYEPPKVESYYSNLSAAKPSPGGKTKMGSVGGPILQTNQSWMASPGSQAKPSSGAKKTFVQGTYKSNGLGSYQTGMGMGSQPKMTSGGHEPLSHSAQPSKSSLKTKKSTSSSKGENPDFFKMESRYPSIIPDVTNYASSSPSAAASRSGSTYGPPQKGWLENSAGWNFRTYEGFIPTPTPTPKSRFTSSQDITMSKLQTMRSSMSPSQAASQDNWAYSQLLKSGAVSCPVGLSWLRHGEGYRCLGGRHFVSDKLLAEGKGGWMTGGIFHPDDQSVWLEWEGPFYEPDPLWCDKSPEELKAHRIMTYGKENPGMEDCQWKP